MQEDGRNLLWREYWRILELIGQQQREIGNLREGFCFLSKADLIIIFIAWLERGQEGKGRRGWLKSRVPEWARGMPRAQMEEGQMWRFSAADTGGGGDWGTESDCRRVGAGVWLMKWAACKSGPVVRGWRGLQQWWWQSRGRAAPGQHGMTLRVSVFTKLLLSTRHRCQGCRVE